MSIIFFLFFIRCSSCSFREGNWNSVRRRNVCVTDCQQLPAVDCHHPVFFLSSLCILIFFLQYPNPVKPISPVGQHRSGQRVKTNEITHKWRGQVQVRRADHTHRCGPVQQQGEGRRRGVLRSWPDISEQVVDLCGLGIMILFSLFQILNFVLFFKLFQL